MIKNFFKEHQEVQEKTLEILEKKIHLASEIISNSLKNNGLIMWCGNGGSASDSMHFAAELIGRFNKNRKSLRSISLAGDNAALTCISNDFGYENVFSRQIEGLGHSGDVLIAISTSGNSINIINAINTAISKNIKVIILTGKVGGKMKDLGNIRICIPSSNTQRIQEGHLLVEHILCESLEASLFKGD